MMIVREKEKRINVTGSSIREVLYCSPISVKGSWMHVCTGSRRMTHNVQSLKRDTHSVPSFRYIKMGLGQKASPGLQDERYFCICAW